MTLKDTKRQLMSLIDGRKSFNDDDCGIFAKDIAALETACEIVDTAIKNQDAGRTYTAFDVIRLVQHVVNEEICGLEEEDCCTAFEIERGIVAELVKEDEDEARD